MARVVADAKFVLDEMDYFVRHLGLAVFQKALKVTRLLVGQLRGPPAPEARDQPFRPVLIPSSKPLTADSTACANTPCRLLERVPFVEVVHETQAADNFRVVHILE
jgi:hypothetical protein